MSKYMAAFILDNLREFEPALKIGNKQIIYITDLGEDAKEGLKMEMGKDLFDKLWESSRIPCIQIYVDAQDEKSAIKKAWINARQVTNALSLIEFDQQNAISIAYNQSPNMIRNVLVANMEEETPSLKIEHYTPPGLMRINLGQLGERAKDFNENIIRHIEKLMPSAMWGNTEFKNSLSKRILHSLHWYTVAMNQQEKEFRFIGIWFALESLVIENIKTKHKKTKIVNRLPTLFIKHNSEEIDNIEVEDLWKLRTEIVHEARSGFMEDRNDLITAKHINLVRYFYLLSILFILDTLELDSNISFKQTWQKLRDYMPSIKIKYDDMPQYVEYENMFMFEQ
jgi:hypothetical protein